VLAIILVNKIPILFQVAKVYISFFRGTPVLIQLLMIYFGLPQLFPVLNDLGAGTAAIIAFSLNTASYLAEIFRECLECVYRGQAEAATSVGMSYWQSMRGIVLP